MQLMLRVPVADEHVLPILVRLACHDQSACATVAGLLVARLELAHQLPAPRSPPFEASTRALRTLRDLRRSREDLGCEGLLAAVASCVGGARGGISTLGFQGLRDDVGRRLSEAARDERAEALEALASFGDATVLAHADVIAARLEDPYDAIRLKAIALLQGCGHIDGLIAALGAPLTLPAIVKDAYDYTVLAYGWLPGDRFDYYAPSSARKLAMGHLRDAARQGQVAARHVDDIVALLAAPHHGVDIDEKRRDMFVVLRSFPVEMVRAHHDAVAACLVDPPSENVQFHAQALLISLLDETTALRHVDRLAPLLYKPFGRHPNRSRRIQLAAAWWVTRWACAREPAMRVVRESLTVGQADVANFLAGAVLRSPSPPEYACAAPAMKRWVSFRREKLNLFCATFGRRCRTRKRLRSAPGRPTEWVEHSDRRRGQVEAGGAAARARGARCSFHDAARGAPVAPPGGVERREPKRVVGARDE